MMAQGGLPEITIAPRDLPRLDLLTGSVVAYRTPVQQFLASELRRARVVPSDRPAAGTVTVRSTVRFRNDETGVTHKATLVYPREEDPGSAKISVLTSIGSALIGLSAGQCILYDDERGTTKNLVVEEVLQSEQRNPTASNLGKEARHAPSIEIVSCEVDHTNPSLEEFAREQAQRLIAQLAEATACPVVIEALRQHPPGVCDATGRRFRFEILTGAPGRPEATAEHA
jgi:regulator of nucleoside diphosphate kinase